MGNALFWFTFLNALLACGVGFGYMGTAGLPPFSAGWLFAALAMTAQLGLIFLLAGGLLNVVRHRLTLLFLAPLLFSTLQVLLMIDTYIYALFRFHWNGLVWNVLTTPGGWESMHISQADLIESVLTIIAVVIAEAGVFWYLTRHTARRTAGGSGRKWAFAAGTLALLSLTDHLIYAYSDLYNVRSVTRAAKLVPFYQPLTVRKFARKRLGIEIDREPELKVEDVEGFLKYPLVPLKTSKPKKSYNVVWIVLDGWRYDSLTPDITPNLWEFAKKCQRFDDHVSGGNATRFGVFSMFYGLYGSYWHNVLAERAGPVLVDRWRQLGYRFKILSSTSLTFPEFRRTAFVQIPEAVDDALPGKDPAEKDAALFERMAAFVKQKDSKPFFTFALTDATHAGYQFPPDAAKFKPYPDTLEYLKLGKGVDPRGPHNRYKNAVFYTDRLIGDFLKELERAGKMKDTIVVITGDHGEEFQEHGAWGHNANFSREEIVVPMLMYVPGRPAKVYAHRTSHHDLAPTFLKLFGVDNPPSDYSLGVDLFKPEGRPYSVSCSWDECALITKDNTLVFATETRGVGGTEVFDRDYRDVPERKAVLQSNASNLSRLLGEMTLFLRK